jgi:hypothetical protein
VKQTPGIGRRPRPGTPAPLEGAVMILIGLIIVIAVVMIVVLPRIWRKL